MHDIISFDMELGTTLQELQALVFRKQHLESMGSYNPEELCFRGASIEDLCLDFSLPGHPDYILRPGDENVCHVTFSCRFYPVTFHIYTLPVVVSLFL